MYCLLSIIWSPISKVRRWLSLVQSGDGVRQHWPVESMRKPVQIVWSTNLGCKMLALQPDSLDSGTLFLRCPVRPSLCPLHWGTGPVMLRRLFVVEHSSSLFPSLSALHQCKIDEELKSFCGFKSGLIQDFMYAGEARATPHEFLGKDCLT